MEYLGVPKPCPGKEPEYERRHRISGLGIFFAVVIPIAAAAVAGWWVWKNWAGRGFGQIRLGEQCTLPSPLFLWFRGLMTIPLTATFDGQAPYIKYPVMAVSAIVAVGMTLPTLASSLWNWVTNLVRRSRTTRYTTRSSFARESGYAAVDEDEGELLGDESDEEV